jgi:hypothetical protein
MLVEYWWNIGVYIGGILVYYLWNIGGISLSIIDVADTLQRIVHQTPIVEW